jgi:multiple sugar transport system permease protein
VRLRSVRSVTVFLLVVLLLVVTLLPIVWIFMTSLKTRAEIFAYPPVFVFEPDFAAFRKFLTPGRDSILKELQNSLIIAFGATGLTLLTSSLAAYSFSRFRFAGRWPLFSLMLASRLLPPITAVIPLFLLMNRLSLVDTHLGLVIIYAALQIPFATWMMKSFFDGIPRDLEMAALIDGCSRLSALRYITIPLAAPGMVATAIFVYVLSWNEFMFAFIFSSVNSKTLPVRLAETLGELQIYWQDMAALAVIIMVPALMFSYYMQKHLVKGLTAGSLK